MPITAANSRVVLCVLLLVCIQGALNQPVNHRSVPRHSERRNSAHATSIYYIFFGREVHINPRASEARHPCTMGSVAPPGANAPVPLSRVNYEHNLSHTFLRVRLLHINVFEETEFDLGIAISVTCTGPRLLWDKGVPKRAGRLHPAPSVDEEQYLVRSKFEPSRIYEVDISTYTCTCLDFPFILYCKHICAVQTLFEEHAPQVLLSSCTTTTPPDASTTLQSPLPEEPSQAPVAKPQSMRKVVAEKLERLAARLRHLSTKEPVELLPRLDQLADQMLVATDKGSVLPAAHHVEPHTKPWRETALSMGVLPKPKTRARPIDANRDPHYGGGTSSGGKAIKRPRKNGVPPSLPPPALSIPSTGSPLPPPPPSHASPHIPYQYYPPYYPQPTSIVPHHYSYMYPATMPKP
ncbi:hypothetical protein DFH07DRAFT_769505 [Mycena maculata]|uniref:SWIM-type domain-containing protein n=1 Tax=Mycena maculata TaxID=230809 RepID=A0AAD7JP12_9AGAR|nr:hypothetical protein DFH07DRAFT_769505 [Mycena maculata]